jgi:hypothetical protein
MPELEHRGKHEAAVAGAVLLLFRRWRPSVRVGIVTEELFVADAIDTLSPRLAKVHSQAFDKLAAEHGLATDGRRLASHWSERTAAKLGRSIARDLDRKIREATRARIEVDEILKTGVLGGARAQNIAITETTRATSIGERDAVNKIGDVLGVKLSTIWVCELKELTPPCKICRPLHRKRKSVWVRRFPFGPPAHPRCRCWKEYE